MILLKMKNMKKIFFKNNLFNLICTKTEKKSIKINKNMDFEYSIDRRIDGEEDNSINKLKIEVTLQPMGGKKVTIITGLGNETECKKHCKNLKIKLGVGGSVKKDEKTSLYVIITQGDNRIQVLDYLTKTVGLHKGQINVHGG